MACRMGRHTWQQGQADVRSFLESGICLAADSDWLLLAAANLALQTGVALYDAIYVSLADQLAVSYITADRRLYNAITSHYRLVRWLGDL